MTADAKKTALQTDIAPEVVAGGCVFDRNLCEANGLWVRSGEQLS